MFHSSHTDITPHLGCHLDSLPARVPLHLCRVSIGSCVRCCAFCNALKEALHLSLCVLTDVFCIFLHFNFERKTQQMFIN